MASSTTCQADGSYTEPLPCKNADDCQDNKCGNGRCVDHEKPTGVHKDDYHCECDSGCKEEITAKGERICGNIPDCPPDACFPWTCNLVNDYQCNCEVTGGGYTTVKTRRRA